MHENNVRTDRMKRSKSAALASRLSTSSGTGQSGPLRKAFQTTVDLLKRRRADLLPQASIDAYVEMDWLMWQGGSLKLTTVGENICAQLRKEAVGLATS